MLRQIFLFVMLRQVIYLSQSYKKNIFLKTNKFLPTKSGLLVLIMSLKEKYD